MTKKGKQNIFALITIFLWASAFPLTKIAMEHYTPNALGFIRCTIAAIFLCILCRVHHIKFPPKKDIPWFFLSGGLGFTLYMIAFNIGMQTLTSATSSILIATTPILTAVAASKLYREKISKIGWVTISMAFIGVVILMLWDGIFSINVGLIWILFAAIIFCSYNLLIRRFVLKGYSSLQIVTYSMTCGAVLLAVFSPQGVQQLMTAGAKQILVVVYLAILASAMAYLFWNKAMAMADKTSDVTNYIFAVPLLSTVMGFIFLKEIPNYGVLIGGTMIIVSLIIFNAKGQEKE
ncbi:MAG: EamA family transporter [Anaerovorax sp.]|nr:EamA family transporter [Anaerovorax sp.]